MLNSIYKFSVVLVLYECTLPLILIPSSITAFYLMVLLIVKGHILATQKSHMAWSLNQRFATCKTLTLEPHPY